MPYCAPQRYFANNRNALLDADLTPSDVLPVAGQVLEIPVARMGSGSVRLTGSYDGFEEATYDVEILDNNADNPFVSSVVSSGAGSGTIENVVAAGAAQSFTIELFNEGIPELAAGVDFEGVRIVARAVGASGNALSLEIDQSGLTFTPQAFSLLADLAAGAGGATTGLDGAAFDWNTKVLSGDNIIPADAHRVAFGDDTTNIYLQYKKYVDGRWSYHFVPEIRRNVAKGSIVNFVTGGRDVDVCVSGTPTETLTGIVTVFDLLNAIKTESALVDVAGVVAYDRSPTGQAAKELLARTDAHVEPSTGSGSEFATGFVDTFANAGAATELITATCYAITFRDHPLAAVGAERWHLVGSVSGNLGDIVTGVPYTDGSPATFGLTIPQVLPEDYNSGAGRFSVTEINYVPRDEGEQEPPICVVAMTLGAEAVDQSIVLRWEKRPSGDCDCSGMTVPALDGDCLGIIDPEGGSEMGLQTDTIAKLAALYTYAAAVIRANSGSSTIDGFDVPVPYGFLDRPTALTTEVFVDPTTGSDTRNIATKNPPNSFKDIVDDFASAVVAIDPVTDAGLRADGMSAWDDAFTALQADIDDTTPMPATAVNSDIYGALLAIAYASAGIVPGKSNASTVQSGDGCWRDTGDDYWWAVVGSDKGAYAPAFNNTPFYSCRRNEDDGLYYSSKEFGFQINIKCPEYLKEGDEIHLAIGDAGKSSTYQIGDVLTLPIIAGVPVQLAGGQDGDPTLEFYVSGSVVGALPSYTYEPGASPAGYLASGVLEFEYVPGGIPNRKGDRWTFALEGGHYRWRKDGGAWSTDSPPLDISDAPAAFDSGLSIEFVAGATPSFEVGDVFSFRALQPWAVSNLRTPSLSRWQWSGATADVVVDMGSSTDVNAALLARHTLPEGATITIEGGDSPGVYLWTESLTWRAGIIANVFTTPRTARYVRISVAAATDGGIGWAWLGDPLTTTLSADFTPRRSYRIENGSAGLDQGGRFLAMATSGEVVFSDSALSDDDVDGLLSLVDWIKSNNDEPFAFMPNVNRPAESYLVRGAVDELQYDESSGMNATPGARDRRYSIAIPLTGVWSPR